MSFAQELVWLLDRATPGLTAYNVPRAIRIQGTLDVEALRAAIGDLIERHEILRTTYATGTGEHGAVQVVQPYRPVDLPMLDLAGDGATEREAAGLRIALEEARTPFDLSNDLLLRSRILRAAEDDHTLILVSHHIASDGWSRGLMYRELSAAYAARVAGHAPTFDPLPVQYGDFAAWQRDVMQGPALEEHLAFWRERLAAPLPVLDLPTDFPRPATQAFDGALRSVNVPAEIVRRLRDFGMHRGATLYMVLLAAYQTVLHRYSGQDDILTGSPIAGRNHHETEGLIGYFANILAMRNSFAGDPTFNELLERVVDNAIDAYEHEDVPFEKLVLDLREGHGTPGHAPLFSCVLTMEDTLPDELRLGDAEVRPYTIDFGQAKFDLTLQVAEKPEGLRLGLWYRTDLFTAGYAERFLGHLHSVLDHALADADRRVSSFPLLTPTEREQLAAWNATAIDEGEPATVVELFEAQVARVPDRVAVRAASSDTASLTYAQLNARVNRLARHLRTSGVAAGQPVGLLLDRSCDAIVGLLAILKVGGAYVPLSVDAPPARLSVQLHESGALAVITMSASVDRLPANVTAVPLDAISLVGLEATNPEPVASPASLAYALYTSGSSGVPKGVAVTHANVVHYARAVSRVLADYPSSESGSGLAALDGWRFGLASTLAADLGNTSLYPALLSGGTLVILSTEATTEPAAFFQQMTEHPLDVLKITPNHFLALAGGKRGDELKAILPSKWLVTGGEALRPEVANVVIDAGGCRLLNHYGPTESTVGVLTFVATSDAVAAAQAQGAQTVPVGTPLANTQVHVVDARGEEQPVGVVGELWIGGLGVADGYLHRPELTTEVFVDHHGARVYRTGDRVRRLPDGTIEFLGRADQQIKVRGYRVELGEVEQVLLAQPGVESAVVTTRVNEQGETRLVAYAVPKPAGYAVSHSDRPTVETLRAWMVAQLPEYMVPSAVMLLDGMPLTPNGKVDRAGLPSPDADVDRTHVAARTETERQLVAIWCAVLKKDEVGVTDSFLDLGGHSLLAIRVLGRISKELGVRLALRALFETPTIEEIAAIVDAGRKQRDADAAMREALAAVESLSDAEVTSQLSGDGAGEGDR